MGFVYGIDADHRGEILWKIQIGKGGALGGIMWGMAVDAEKVYVPLSVFMLGPGRSVIWDLDTLHDFETVNGVKAHAGSMNATGRCL